jgi:hypothetical protein
MLTFRNSKIVYYGPHGCDNCGAVIVKMGAEFGGTAFNAPDSYPYPNTEWHPHVCDPAAVAKMRTDAEKAGLEPSYAPVEVARDGRISISYSGSTVAAVDALRTNAISGQPLQRGVR